MLTGLVDPFHGTDGMGNCLVGPYLPFSLVRLGPDVCAPQPTSGYRSGRPIKCFSHTHVSGTGGGGRYGNIGVLPFCGVPRWPVGSLDPSDEEAACGSYAVTLNPGNIRCELTSTPRTGVHRYRFAPEPPAPAESGGQRTRHSTYDPHRPASGPGPMAANILLDVGAVIQVKSGDLKAPGVGTGASLSGFIEAISATELVGRGDFRGGWGHDFPYSVYFFARFEQVPEKIIVGNAAGAYPGVAADGAGCWAVAHFGSLREVVLRVGISYCSVARARASVERESAGRSFEEIRTAAGQTWEAALSAIRVEGGSPAQREIFYSLFSRLLCMPSDLGVDDEFSQWSSGVRHFTDFYALWDSVRNANSLLALIDPDLHVAMMNCLLDIADKRGWLPDCWIAGHSAKVQGGSSADVLLCESALKGFAGIDYARALRQMRKNNEQASPDPYLFGRYTDDYHALGYVSTRVVNCVSRHLEYAYQDWCTHRLAKGLGQIETADRYLEQAKKVWNLWNQETGFFAPRRPDGTWVEPFDPDYHRPDSWNDPYFYEGNSWQWSWYVPADMAGLIRRLGGPEAFIARLDAFFDGGRYFSKETMQHVPWLYHYAGRPDRSADRCRQYMASDYATGRDGLIDNEDMGCQSAWYMGSAMGLYPIAGQDVYLLSAPVFERVEIALGQAGRRLVLEARRAGNTGMYVQGARINGTALTRSWVRHAEIAAGATIELELGPVPGDWGTRPEDLPPSPLSDTGG